MVKYNKVDRGRSGASDKSFEKLLKSQELSKSP